ncbi:hypothetical protein H0H93_014084 [Arthromyces matolae]|nr:hypothetical protein H0H93_014084 [Arthromyces matolae]
MCQNQNAQCNYLGGGEGKSAWKVDLSESHGAIYVLKVFTGHFLPYQIAVELHNLDKVKQVVEWGEIVTVKNKLGGRVRAVYYILMHYMGMTEGELEKKYPGLECDYQKLGNAALLRYSTEYKIKNEDVAYDNIVYRVEEKDGKKLVTAEVIDWESAKDLTRLPPVFPENVPVPQREVEDRMLGKFLAKKTS